MYSDVVLRVCVIFVGNFEYSYMVVYKILLLWLVFCLIKFAITCSFKFNAYDEVLSFYLFANDM
jgi:hypothetical protein